MKKFKQHTLKQYLDVLASQKPVPGGGSAAALTGALGAALITMAARYSKGKTAADRKKIQAIIRASEKIRNQLLALVDRDAEAYLKLVRAKGRSLQEKRKAKKGAREVPLTIAKLCYQAVKLTSFLIKKGNKYLVSDLEAALEMLLAAFHAAIVMVKVNV